ncbi:sulfatase-like hydrolase/transferase [Microvirga sp. BT689]|uniref:sulfatase-like hydrolase/transferase n=1 Tax=Microvirga arvi TaxID=2778731 RepID=UPI00194FC1FC|nr:sulfatase-like hydrolase/transferase [Microvirga arvi]MBM6580352.1 sulfatase-like hydrolase/transferase [Microvirga arvi]
MSLLNDHLNHFDFIMIWEMLRKFDLSVVMQYHELSRHFLLYVILFICTLLIVWFLEHLVHRKKQRSSSFRLKVVLLWLIIATLQSIVFFNSRYLDYLHSASGYLTATEPGGLRVGNFIAFLERTRSIQAALQKEAEDTIKSSIDLGSPQQTQSADTSCSSCPDMIFVHLESTFDPVILEDYTLGQGYLDLTSGRGLAHEQSGPLLVNIFGGRSWISEFELLCGVHHQMFDDGGTYPHSFIAPFTRSCVPSYLKTLGYETHAIYTANPFFAGVAEGFKRYGIDTFLDNKKINAPTNWKEQRDFYYVDALRRLLAQPSNHPRFVFLSTNSNHGPHGASPREQYPGPFNPDSAKSVELKDYINRLNDTYQTMLDLEQELGRIDRSVAILFYGDHQPHFKKIYSQRAQKSYGSRLRNITFYRMARNYDASLTPTKSIIPGPVRIDSLARLFMEFAGIPLSRNMIAAKMLTHDACASNPNNCPTDVKRAVRMQLLKEPEK